MNMFHRAMALKKLSQQSKKKLMIDLLALLEEHSLSRTFDPILLLNRLINKKLKLIQQLILFIQF